MSTVLRAPEPVTESVHPGTKGDALRVPSLDGFRALAVLWIFLLHVWYASPHPPLDRGLLRTIVASGYLGLDLLFILSGFVLFLPAAVNQGSLGSIKAYALRRAARIMPGYYAALLIVLVFHRWISPAAVVESPWSSPHGLWAFVSHLLFLQMYVFSAALQVGYGLLGVTWTLSLEATFYVVLPFVARTFYRHPIVCLGVALGGAELWQLAIAPAGGIQADGPVALSVLKLAASVPTYAGHFALGMAGAMVYVRLRKRAQGRTGRLLAPAVQIASVVALLGFCVHRMSNHPLVTNYVLEKVDTGFMAVLIAALMVSTALGPPWAQWPFSNRLLAGLGDASYGVYLSHALLLAMCVGLLGVNADGSNTVFWELIFFTIPPAMGIGWLSCRFIEQPSREWARRRIRSKRPKVPTFPPADLIPAALRERADPSPANPGH